MANYTDEPPLGSAEFGALRTEILQRAQFQQQLVSLSVVIAGTLLTVFFQFKAPSLVLLTYPVLALFLALEWSFNNTRIRQIGRYIRTEVEDAWAGPGWENHLASHAPRDSLSWLSGSVLALGSFALLPALVVFLAVLSGFSSQWPALAFLVADASALVSTTIVLRRSDGRLSRVADAAEHAHPADSAPRKVSGQERTQARRS